MIDLLQAAGDRTLRISNPATADRAHYRSLIHLAKQHHLVPDGHHLRHTGRDRGDIVLRLNNDADPNNTDWNRVRGQTLLHLTTAGEIIAALTKDPANLALRSGDALDHALDIVSDFIDIATKIGHLVHVSIKGAHPRIYLTVDGRRSPVHVWQEYDQTPHIATADEMRRARREWQYRIPAHDIAPRLQFSVRTELPWTNAVWSGITRANRRTRIAAIFEDLAVSIEAARERHAVWLKEYEAERERQRIADEQRHHEWKKVIKKANRQAGQQIRGATFQSAYDAWRRARDIRDFCAALQHAFGESASDDLQEWIAWGLATADDIDPTVGPTTLAAVSYQIKPRPDDLRPFLDGWSPHEAERDNGRHRDGKNLDVYSNPWHPGRGHKQPWWRS